MGFPLDEIRVKALWPAFHQGVKHIKDTQSWAEWWILWRRVAAGLSKQHHEEIARRVTPFLLPAKGTSPSKKASRPRPEPHEMAEIWRCAASLERLVPELKESLGETLAKDLSRPTLGNHVLWSLGRLGARVPLYGPANTTVRKEVVESWVHRLLAREFTTGRETTDAVFALTQLSQVSGDRARDLDADLRDRVSARLAALGASDEQILPVRQFTERAAAELGEALGDSLPVGLRLLGKAESGDV